MSRKVDVFSISSSTGTWPPPTGQSVMFLGSASLTSNTGDDNFHCGCGSYVRIMGTIFLLLEPRKISERAGWHPHERVMATLDLGSEAV